MVATTTLILAVVIVVAAIVVIGTERTTATAAAAARRGSEAARSGYGVALAGITGGLMLGDALLQAAIMEPFAVTTALAGIMGALGIAGFLGGITGLQFLLLGLGIFLTVVYVFE